MDYWQSAHAELKKVFAALKNVHGLSSAVRKFAQHASRFGMEEPISDYPQWSDDLGTLRDDVIRSGEDQRIQKIAELLTELVWRGEYGALDEDGYRNSLELSALAEHLANASNNSLQSPRASFDG